MRTAVVFEVSGIVSHELIKRAGWRNRVPGYQLNSFGVMLHDHNVTSSWLTDKDVTLLCAPPDTDERIVAILVALEDALEDPERIDDAYRMMVEAGYP